jgi:ribosomal protein S18 acetylase RimI-like enzyme
MTEFSLLPANLRDLGSLRILEKECFGKDAWPLIDLIGVLSFPGIVRIKVVINNSMVGFAAGEVHQDNQMGWITTIGVSPAYRQQGIASDLLKAIELELHMDRIRLSVRKSNTPAIQMYKKYGYMQVGLWPAYYEDREDALILEKTLQSES